jgi:hypothetical protein
MMERLNGEIRDREKVMRGLRKPETPVIPGYQIYHNYLRPHEALEGKTPADACGIEVQGENKWMTLIQNAAKRSTATEFDHVLVFLVELRPWGGLPRYLTLRTNPRNSRTVPASSNSKKMSALLKKPIDAPPSDGSIPPRDSGILYVLLRSLM